VDRRRVGLWRCQFSGKEWAYPMAPIHIDGSTQSNSGGSRIDRLWYPSLPIARFLGVCLNQTSLAAILALLMPARKPVQLLIEDWEVQSRRSAVSQLIWATIYLAKWRESR
jgi:hypothetical protein